MLLLIAKKHKGEYKLLARRIISLQVFLVYRTYTIISHHVTRAQISEIFSFFFSLTEARNYKTFGFPLAMHRSD